MAFGFGLLLALLGTSITLSGVGQGGGGNCASGGLTNIGSSVREVCNQKETFEKAQKIIDEDREARDAI